MKLVLVEYIYWIFVLCTSNSLQAPNQQHIDRMHASLALGVSLHSSASHARPPAQRDGMTPRLKFVYSWGATQPASQGRSAERVRFSELRLLVLGS